MPKTAKRLARDAQYRQPRNSFVIDPNCGICSPQPWRILKSAGFSVLQIDTRPNIVSTPISDDDPKKELPR
jgi:hypothetical protein